MQLILMRHPPVLEGAGRCYGRLDLVADEQALPASLAALVPYRGWPVYTSPAQRCRQLAEAFHPAPEVWPDLQELDFGRWEGMRWDDVPRTELDAWAADIWHYQPGGGESAAMLLARWESAVRGWQAQGLERVVVVTHAGVIRMALAQAGLIDEEVRWDWPIEYGRAYEIEYV